MKKVKKQTAVFTNLTPEEKVSIALNSKEVELAVRILYSAFTEAELQSFIRHPVIIDGQPFEFELRKCCPSKIQ